MDMLDGEMPQISGQGGKKGPDIREIISVVWRKKWMLLVPFIVCFIGGVGIARVWPKNYESEVVLQYPRLGIEGEVSVQDTRFHQIKFRERAEHLQLKVLSPSTWSTMLDSSSSNKKYRSDIKFIDRNKGPSLGYRIKNLFTGTAAPDKQLGLNEQIEDVISNIRIEISETDPSVRITCVGDSPLHAQAICEIVKAIFVETDDERFNVVEREKKARRGIVEKDREKLRNVEERIRNALPSSVSAQYMRSLQEGLRNTSGASSNQYMMLVEIRTKLHNALSLWRRQPKEKKMTIDLDAKDDKAQNEQPDMLVSDLITQYKNYRATLNKSTRDGERNYNSIGAELQKLYVRKAIEDEQIFKLMYMSALDDLEKAREAVVEDGKIRAANIKALLNEKIDLLAEAAIDKESPQVVEIDKKIKALKKEALKSITTISNLSGDIAVYQRLKRLLSAKDIMVDLADEDGMDGEGDASQDLGVELTKQNLDKLIDERDKANGARERISDEWFNALESSIILYKECLSLADSLKTIEADRNSIKKTIEDGNEAEIIIEEAEQERKRLRAKLDIDEERLKSAEDAVENNSIDRMRAFVEPTQNYVPTTNSYMILAGFAFMGLVIGVGLVAITEITDSTIKSPKDLRSLTNQPVLAAIPAIEAVPELPEANEALFYRTKNQVEQDIASGAMFDSSYLRDIRFRNIATEQIRKLRSAILESGTVKGSRPRTFLITSALAGEGKTIVSANLAIAISQMIGEHVLLVDSDLRQPDIHNLFNLPARPGLSEYLTEDIDLADLLVKTEYEKLTLLQAGKVPANSTELLDSDKMWNLIKELRSRYDDRYILIDSPPIMSTSEPEVLAEQVDGIILVVRAGMTPREIIEDTLMHMSRDKVVGIVMNDVKGGYSRYYVPTYVHNA